MGFVLLALCLLLVAPYTDVIGTEFIGSPDIDQWQQDFPPSITCIGKNKGDLVADPENCHKFFICDGHGQWSPDSYPCEDGCFITNKCDIDPSNCTASGCDIPTTTITPTHTCNTECGTIVGTPVYNKKNCSKYSICIGVTIIDASCNSTAPYFNGRECGDDPSACCSCDPDVYYTCGGTEVELIPDTMNCKQYYACVLQDGTTWTPVGPITCEDNGSFNADTQKCDPTITECDNACPAGDGGVTSPTSISTTTASISSTSTSISSTTASTSSTTTSNPTTPASTSTKPTTVRTSTTYDGCFDLADFHCLAHGDYAHCTFCDPSYIHCYNTASTPILEDCPKGKLFNTNPAYPGCILPENCPFP